MVPNATFSELCKSPTRLKCEHIVYLRIKQSRIVQWLVIAMCVQRDTIILLRFTWRSRRISALSLNKPGAFLRLRCAAAWIRTSNVSENRKFCLLELQFIPAARLLIRKHWNRAFIADGCVNKRIQIDGIDYSHKFNVLINPVMCSCMFNVERKQMLCKYQRNVTCKWR